MDDIKFRKATKQDLPTLHKFEQELIAYERPFDSNLKAPCTYYDFDYLLNSDKTQLIVAHKGAEIIGSGYAKIVSAQSYHKNPEYAYMGFMFVKPNHRGQGIIQNIIEQLKQWALSQNILEARLEVYSENASALKAYEKKGFNAHMLEMKISLA